MAAVCFEKPVVLIRVKVFRRNFVYTRVQTEKQQM